MNPRTLLFNLFFIISISCGYAQDDPVKWINKHAKPLTTDTSLSDLTFLSSLLKDNLILGLGEASHGTKEFYDQKKRIIQYLVVNLKYKNLGFEFQDLVIEPVNQYVLNGKGDLKDLMKGFALYNTTEIYEVFRFIKLYNDKQSLSDKVKVFGFDKEEFWPDPLSRDKHMADLALENKDVKVGKTIIWGHNVHIAKDTTMAKVKAMGSYLKEALSRKYYAIGFDTFNGTVNVINDGEFVKHDFKADQQSYAQLFATSNYKNFLISFDDKTNPFFGIKNNITNIYSNWMPPRALPIRPGVDFDAIIFLRDTNASTQLR